MAKRRVQVESDDEDRVEDVSPSSKRARTEENSDEGEASPSTQGRATKRSRNATQKKGKSKAREDTSDNEDPQDEQDNPDEEDEEQMAAHEKLFRATLEARRKHLGGIAEHGVIEHIEMHQFMCHKFLSFSFGPQINFIIGHNGSGKSAVLSAITIALGGKSNFTGRGNGLKSFIREGQSISEITISLKNQGDEAFKPKEYGKSIRITRRFTKDGSSSWKIRSHDNKVISTKKDELSAICDHMNIQVDNPMNVLTQDAARQFLSASQPGEKYQFFLRGTQLSQLSGEYETCLENIHSTEKILEQKKSLLPELKQAQQEAIDKYNEAKKARDQKSRISQLKTEKAWALVYQKEAELKVKAEVAAKQSRRIPKIEGELKEFKEQVEKASKQIEENEVQLNAMGGKAELDEKYAKLKEQSRTHKAKIMNCTNDLNRAQASRREIKETIIGIDEQIAQETQRLASDTQAKRDEHQRKIEKVQREIEEAEAARRSADQRLEAVKSQSSEIQKRGEVKDAELNNLKETIMDVRHQIEQLEKAEKDRYAVYGPNIMSLLRAIEQTRWSGDTPLGPLGVHIKVRDAQKWADLLSLQLGNLLTAFAVTNARDRQVLKQLLDQNKCGHMNIIIYEKDMFDYSHGEPAPELPTVLRALDIADPYVLRILINQRQIERMFLGHTRREAENILARAGHGIAWTADWFTVRRFPEGGGSSGPIERRGGRDGGRVFLSGGDAAQRKEALQVDLANLEARYHPLKEEVGSMKQQFTTLKTQEAPIMNDGRAADSALAQAKRQLRQLQSEVNEELPVNIAALEDHKREQENERENILRQSAEISNKRQELEELFRQCGEESKSVKKRIDEYNETQNGYKVQIEEAAETRLKAQSNVRFREDQLKKEQAQLEDYTSQLDLCTTEFEEWTASAQKIGERVETRRKPDEITRQMESLATALRERERRQGATVDELESELNRVTDLYNAAQKDWKQMNKLNKARSILSGLLKDSLSQRTARWQEFRRHIALRCKMVFKYNLSQRGYYGNILFNHRDGKLELKVQTDDQNATQGARDKDPRALSGGEKSFSTICLLLALWESIGCPLRCLDEFDVFMDAVNRRIAMKMMIDTANQSDKKQYILITPQDMNNIHIGPSVRVHRMTDPERGQGVLAMG
ncbi:P-loop containing nucleoside triphosphate hydrolase protein [Dendrothele bispora CBS 962.96]|uniref:P-loop containing nucleoside triphosphate hydrolase protein n=1 Tax=Dendrothele bispora (strain CBS 962.96) TaxID=1314807 RepID=A0A4S8MRE9_DENBC|nr:P-loop containing nucleoside triphosphate hydrolase protein [Dendrothele bispora CBS 962.96]